MSHMAKQLLPVKIDRGDGPAVVLLHGLGNNHKSWSFVLKHLGSSVRVIVPDLLGFGDAPKPNAEYSPADHAKATAMLESGELDRTAFTQSVVRIFARKGIDPCKLSA